MVIINTGKHNKYYLKENRKAFYFPNEWSQLMKLAKPRQALTCNILINTGARINEAQHIKVKDIQVLYDRKNIVIRQVKVRAKLKETRPEPRIIPISSKFYKELQGYIRKYKLKPDDYFPMLSRNGLDSFLKRASKKIGREDWRDFSPHNIRKTTESWLVALDIDMFKILKHLGHTYAVASKNYVNADIFSIQDKMMIRQFYGDLYLGQRRF